MAASYQGLRRTAIAVAREAGAHLLRDFRRPGGARGSGAHADADEEAERLIRDRLLAATPGFGFLGEETGRVDGTPGQPIWVVDPNDGTAAYLRGFRGSSTSIALVDAGVPVLGVVFAYAWPDDEGELFAWAEGDPVTTPPSTGVVFVSQDADRNAVANARCIAPETRFFALPSVAHRLARVGAGDGDGAVCLSGCASWDVAAGHALLRGRGHALVDERGRPFTYDARAEGSLRFGFAGAPARIAAMAGNPWDEVRRRGGPPSPFVEPRRGHGVADVARLRRCQGLWMGQLIGDALGAQVEFQSAAEISARYPDGVRTLRDGGTWGTLAGQPTDDSELALALARSLVACGGYDREAVRAAYLAWLGSSPFDVGATVSGGLRGRPNPDSLANGALMRVSPIALALAHDRRAAIAAARADAVLTHVHPACADANAVYVAALIAALEGASPAEIVGAALGEPVSADHVHAVVEAARDGAPHDYVTHQGFYAIALQNAFFQLLHAPSFEEGLVDTVGRGGDTDTNACIAGALLGAHHGRTAIHADWLRAVLTCRPLAETGAPRARPREYWPVDALLLAERLAER